MMSAVRSGAPLLSDPPIVPARLIESAITEKDHTKLERWISLGLDPNDMSHLRPMAENGFPGGWPLLYHAIGTSDPNFVRRLLECGADPLKQVHPEFGSTPLMRACARGNTEIVRLLIEAGDDVNACLPSDGWTVAHHAASCHTLEILVMLEARGARMDVRSKDGRSLLHLASDNADCARWMLDRHPELLNHQDSDGCTPLMWSAIYNDLEGARFLISRGAALEIHNSRGQTALQIASERNHQRVFEELNGFVAADRARRALSELASLGGAEHRSGPAAFGLP